MTPAKLVSEFRRLAAEADRHSRWVDLCDYRKLAEARIDVGRSEAYSDAAQRLEKALEGTTIVVWRGVRSSDIQLSPTADPPSNESGTEH